MSSKMPIDPETKVGDLLQAYPHLEEVLISASPAFKQLRNPVLRRTVAKVATIRRIAGVGGLELKDLIHTLRREAGIESDLEEAGRCAADEAETMPDLEALRTAAELDADALEREGLGCFIRSKGPGQYETIIFRQR